MRSGMFDNTEVYSADFARFAAGLLTNGVLADSLTALQVSAGTGMQVSVAPGYCWINGRFGVAETAETLSIAAADGSLGRVDRVVARLDLSAPSVSLQVIQGAASANPVAPDPVRSGNYYDLGLATISVPAGTIAITASLITDTRNNSSVCGAVIYRNADAMALDGKADKSAIINPFTPSCRNLGKVFESEINNFNGDAYAWIKSRITANNIDDIFLGDYLPPFEVEWNSVKYEYTPRVWRIGKAIVPGQTAYIDFKCDELWFQPIPFQKGNYAGGLNIADNPSYGNVVITSAYIASYLHHCLNGQAGYYVDLSGSSNVLAYFEPPETGDASENIIGLFPNNVKQHIIEKRKYVHTYYPTTANSQPTQNKNNMYVYQNDISEDCELTNVGKLWLPNLADIEGIRGVRYLANGATGFWGNFDVHLKELFFNKLSLTSVNPDFVNQKRYIVAGNGYNYRSLENVYIDFIPRLGGPEQQRINGLKLTYPGTNTEGMSTDWEFSSIKHDDWNNLMAPNDPSLPLIFFTF